MSILSGILAQQIAQNEGLKDTNKYLLLGWMLNGPLGLGVTLALANQEADSTPIKAPTVSGPVITTATALPPGTENAQYAWLLQASGGTGKLSWQLVPGTSLPQQLTLSTTGILSGVPAVGTANTYSLSIQVSDSATPTAATATRVFTLTIAPAPAAQIAVPQQQPPAGQPAVAAAQPQIGAGGKAAHGGP
jgi:hypothetical protein